MSDLKQLRSPELTSKYIFKENKQKGIMDPGGNTFHTATAVTLSIHTQFNYNSIW